MLLGSFFFTISEADVLINSVLRQNTACNCHLSLGSMMENPFRKKDNEEIQVIRKHRETFFKAGGYIKSLVTLA